MGGSDAPAMKSPRGVAGAALMLAALPLAAICQTVLGAGLVAALHLAFALGSGILAFAVHDFKTPTWATWLGSLAIGLLAGIFALQGISTLTGNGSLTRIAYDVLGQHLEGWLLNAFLLWCVAVLLTDSRGATRIVGFVAVLAASAVRVYATAISLRGADPDTLASGLKLLYLAPFLWLLLESLKRAPRRA